MKCKKLILGSVITVFFTALMLGGCANPVAPNTPHQGTNFNISGMISISDDIDFSVVSVQFWQNGDKYGDPVNPDEAGSFIFIDVEQGGYYITASLELYETAVTETILVIDDDINDIVIEMSALPVPVNNSIL